MYKYRLTPVRDRVGPDTKYPVVAVVSAGVPLVTSGCVEGYSWCDVRHGSSHGWIAARYLATVVSGRPVAVTAVVAPRIGVPVVVFSRPYRRAHHVGYSWSARRSLYW
ncbi:MAG: SH3 domain-containing protein [Devosia sp.]